LVDAGLSVQQPWYRDGLLLPIALHQPGVRIDDMKMNMKTKTMTISQVVIGRMGLSEAGKDQAQTLKGQPVEANRNLPTNFTSMALEMGAGEYLPVPAAGIYKVKAFRPQKILS
jgi:hypothetical protein